MNKENEIGIIGGNGFIGRELAHYLRDQRIEVISPSSEEVNITDYETVDNFIKNNLAESIVLLAAYTDVKNAQTPEGEKLAFDINTKGTENVAKACQKYGKHLIYISTDFVFEGTEDNPGLYEINDPVAKLDSPNIGNYARSKIMAEQILEIYDNVALIRISYPFYNIESPKDYIYKLKSMVEKGYKIVSDQQITPTYVVDLVQAIEIIFEQKLTGKFHVATYPPTTPHELISYFLGRDDIQEGSLIELIKNGATSVPVRGGLGINQSQEKLLNYHSWQSALDEIK